MKTVFLITTIVFALVGCNKDEPPTSSSSVNSETAMHKFLERKTKKVRSIAEIEADEKAKEAKNGTQK